MPHYYYVIKAINATGTGSASNEVDLSAGAVAVDDADGAHHAAFLRVLFQQVGGSRIERQFEQAFSG